MLLKCMFGVLVISSHVAVSQGSSGKGFDTRVAVKPRYFFLKFPGKSCIIRLIMKERIILIHVMKEPKIKRRHQNMLFTSALTKHRAIDGDWCISSMLILLVTVF